MDHIVRLLLYVGLRKTDAIPVLPLLLTGKVRRKLCRILDGKFIHTALSVVLRHVFFHIIAVFNRTFSRIYGIAGNAVNRRTKGQIFLIDGNAPGIDTCVHLSAIGGADARTDQRFRIIPFCLFYVNRSVVLALVNPALTCPRDAARKLGAGHSSPVFASFYASALRVLPGNASHGKIMHIKGIGDDAK